MENKKIENLLDITYKILLEQNKDIKRYTKEKNEVLNSLDEENDNFFQLEVLSEKMVNSLLEEKKDYFFRHIKDFIVVHGLSEEIREHTLKKLEENCSDETDCINENSVYKECSADSIRIEEKMKRKFSDEEKAIFEIYSDVSADIESMKSHLFYEAMLQTGAFLKKIEEVTEV